MLRVYGDVASIHVKGMPMVSSFCTIGKSGTTQGTLLSRILLINKGLTPLFLLEVDWTAF